jgi:predicted metal-dependent phosphoesterase TrpH
MDLTDVFKKHRNLIGKRVMARPHGRVLSKLGFMGVDMHSHTIHSDGNASTKTLLRVAKLRKIGLAITDHNVINGSLIASRQKKVPVIPGVELTAKTGRDILAYFYSFKDLVAFYSKHIKGKQMKNKLFSLERNMLKQSDEELIESSRDYNATLVIPHPYCFPYKYYQEFYTDSPFLKYMHGVEVLNSAIWPERNLPALEFAKKLKKGFVGGSDAHNRLALGRAVTVARADSIGSFLDAIRKRKTGVIGKEIPLKGRFLHSIEVVRNNLF